MAFPLAYEGSLLKFHLYLSFFLFKLSCFSWKLVTFVWCTSKLFSLYTMSNYYLCREMLYFERLRFLTSFVVFPNSVRTTFAPEAFPNDATGLVTCSAIETRTISTATVLAFNERNVALAKEWKERKKEEEVSSFQAVNVKSNIRNVLFQRRLLIIINNYLIATPMWGQIFRENKYYRLNIK